VPSPTRGTQTIQFGVTLPVAGPTKGSLSTWADLKLLTYKEIVVYRYFAPLQIPPWNRNEER